MIRPKSIQLVGEEVAIRWNDGTESYYPMEYLRAQSPSAENMGERDLLGKQIGGTDQVHFPGVRVTRWQPIGGYAIQFTFSDGHTTGLYSFDYLKGISPELPND